MWQMGTNKMAIHSDRDLPPFRPGHTRDSRQKRAARQGAALEFA
jgi:hypothetical protein